MAHSVIQTPNPAFAVGLANGTPNPFTTAI